VTMMTLKTGSPTMGLRKRCSVKSPRANPTMRVRTRAGRIGNPPLVEGQADIGSDQGELPHGKIEDSGAFVDQGPSQCDQGINAADQNPGNEKLQKKLHATS